MSNVPVLSLAQTHALVVDLRETRLILEWRERERQKCVFGYKS